MAALLIRVAMLRGEAGCEPRERLEGLEQVQRRAQVQRTDVGSPEAVQRHNTGSCQVLQRFAQRTTLMPRRSVIADSGRMLTRDERAGANAAGDRIRDAIRHAISIVNDRRRCLVGT